MVAETSIHKEALEVVVIKGRLDNWSTRDSFLLSIWVKVEPALLQFSFLGDGEAIAIENSKP